MQSLEWMDESLCRGKHSDFWFPPLEETNHVTYYRLGKSLCFQCPVWKECLDFSVTNEEVWGCWGGVTPQERKNPHRVAHGTVEKFRLGCRCKECKHASVVRKPSISVKLFPNAGETYDLDSLIFTLSNG